MNINYKLPILTAAILAFFDRLLKFALQNDLMEQGPFFNFDFPRLTFHFNKGLAGGLSLDTWIIITLSVILISLLAAWLIHSIRTKEKRTRGIILVLGGALSNLFDRIAYGAVIDTIEIVPNSIWNIADFMIAAGIILIIFSAEKHKRL